MFPFSSFGNVFSHVFKGVDKVMLLKCDTKKTYNILYWDMGHKTSLDLSLLGYGHFHTFIKVKGSFLCIGMQALMNLSSTEEISPHFYSQLDKQETKHIQIKLK